MRKLTITRSISGSARTKVSSAAASTAGSALQHLLDGVFVQLCEGDEQRHVHLLANLERVQQMLEP